MARWGVSVYLGTPDLAERLANYLAAVARRGGREVFTSLHIPETPLEAALEQVRFLVGQAAAQGLAVVADIAPRVMAALGANPGDLRPLADLGLSGVRLDYGFSPAEIARMARNRAGVRVVLNASTADADFLAAVMAEKPDPELLEGWHNYYPRPETGLSLQHLLRTSRWFKERGLRVAAFVPGTSSRRGPLYAGLPTLERHRQAEAGRAAAELLATGAVDTVLIGDPWATEAELDRVAAVARAGGVVLRVRLTPGLPEQQRAILLDQVHRNRPDAAEAVVRSATSRLYATEGPPIEPFHTVARPRGSVTIDNKGYLRYAGELQITLQDLPPDPRVNVVARVIDEDLPLLDWIGPGQTFQFVAVQEGA